MRRVRSAPRVRYGGGGKHITLTPNMEEKLRATREAGRASRVARPSHRRRDNRPCGLREWHGNFLSFVWAAESALCGALCGVGVGRVSAKCFMVDVRANLKGRDLKE